METILSIAEGVVYFEFCKYYSIHSTMRLINVFYALLMATYVSAVKEYLFKDCDKSGFCSRNRHYAKAIEEQGTAYQPRYTIDPQHLKITEDDGFRLSGNIIKTLHNKQIIELPIEVTLVEGNNVRVHIDEKREKSSLTDPSITKYLSLRRYNETPSWAFNDPKLPLLKTFKIEEQNEKLLEVLFGDDFEYSVQIQFYPIKITVKFKSEDQVVINEQNFLNVEHLRPESVNSEHLLPEESDFDMFHDSFQDSKTDKLPFGPESIGVDFTLNGFNYLYGIPEHADSFSLKDTTTSNLPYRLFNVDIFEYETNSRMPMYGSIPFLLAVKPEVSVGIFWINSADTYVDIKKGSDKSSSHWISESGVLDFMILIDKTPDLINKNYGIVTGYPNLPAQFSLGYHQCRWNYNDKQDVLNINNLMDENQIPYDTIWLDIEYAETKKYFTWLPENFPNPEEMLLELDRTGRNLVVIVDPHLKTGYNVSDLVVQKRITINDPSNKTHYGHCWPGESIWIDTMNPNSQEYWDYLFRPGSDNYFMGGKSTNIHLWNDMNEPSVFDGPETSSQKDNLHYGGWEHRSIHNVFGLTYHEATYDSLLKRQVDTDRQRPFILTRSYFAGSQRTVAMWTGDNMSKWEYLKASIPMVLTSNVVGMPFAGADVGGFFGNPSKELLTRWYQTGIWYPFFRAHAHIDSRRREPWVPGDPYTSIIRDALKLRYALLPEFYTAFHESSVNGSPVIRPIFYDNLQNLEAYAVEDEFYLGNTGLLIKPVTEDDVTEQKIYVPNTGIFYEYTSGEFNGKLVKLEEPGYYSVPVQLSDIPMLFEGGHIIARKNRYRRLSKLMARDPYTLVVALDSNGQAKGHLYIDDGESFRYERGEYVDIEFEFTGVDLLGKPSSPSAEYLQSADLEIEKIELLGELASSLHSAAVVNDGKVIEMALHPEENKVTVRKPLLKVNSEWRIQFSTLPLSVEKNVETLLVTSETKETTGVEHDEL